MIDKRPLYTTLLLACSTSLVACSMNDTASPHSTKGTSDAKPTPNVDDPSSHVPVSSTVATIRQERAIKWLKMRGTHVRPNAAGQVVRIGLSESTTDEGAAHVAALTSLKSLVLNRTQITDAGLGRLTELDDVESLVVGFSDIGDAGMRHVSAMESLRFLTVQRTQVGDAGVEALSGLPELEALKLSSCPVTDAGLAHIARIKRLRFLKLTYLPVTDAGLMQLAKLEELKTLILAGGGVTSQGVESLREALPNCSIRLLDPSDGCVQTPSERMLAEN